MSKIMDLLVKHFRQVHTLKDWLQTIVGDDNHTARSVLIQNSDDESYRRLLTCVFVCEDTKICSVPNVTASPYHPQKEIVLTAIQRILSKKGYGKNVLTNGFCLMSADPFALSCGVNVESRYPNSCVNRLFYPAWEMLLSRACETAMMFLLEHTSLFYQVTPTCMVQISGAPINNSVETVAHKVKRTTPVKQQVQNSDEIEVTAEDRKNADEEYEKEKVQEDTSDNLKEINSRKVGECSMACSGTSEVKRNSNSGSKTNKVIFGDIKGVEQVDLCVKRSKKCNKHKRKNDCNVIKKIVKGKKKRKYEQIHENRFLELKRRSEIYASQGKLFVDQTLGELDNETLEDIQSGVSAKGVAGELKEVHTLKRKVGDTDLENGDEMEDVDHEFETKRRRLQSRSYRCTEDATNVLNEEKNYDKDVVETAKVTSKYDEKRSKYRTTDGTTVSKTPKKRRKCKRKHSKVSEVKDKCRPFCPFEFQLALPKKGILFSRNPIERFTQSVLLSRLGTTSEDILLLYKEIFCETNVLRDTESVRVTSPDLYSIQRALGISVDTGMTENLEGDSLQNCCSADLNPHPNFWNESSGKKALLPDSSGTCALIETSKCGVSKLCSNLSTDAFSDTNGKDSNDSVEMGMCEVCEKGNEEAVVIKVKGDNSKSFESVGVQDCGSGRISCETCNSRCGKEAPLVKRKHEMVLSRRNTEPNRFVKNSPTQDTVFIHPGRKEVEQDIQFRNYNRSNTGCLHASSETTEMQMSSVNPCSVMQETSAVLREKEGDSKIGLHVGTSQNSAQGEFGRQNSDHLSPSARSTQDVCTSQQSVQSVSKQTVDIPVFTGIVPLLQQLIEKHRLRCPFKALLKHHCPALCKKSASRVCVKTRRGKKGCRGLTVSQLLSNHHHHRQVYLFLRACIVRVLPVQLLGTRHNLNILLKNVSKFISLGKYDRLTLGQVMYGLKTSEVEWLSGTIANSVKLHLLARLVFWLFGYILVILKTFFFVTDTGFLSDQTMSADEVPKEIKVKTTSTGRPILQKASSSFVDPFNDSFIDVTLVEDIEDEDANDPDYVPEFEMTAVLDETAQGLEELAFEEIEFNMEEEGDEDVEGEEPEIGEGVRKIKGTDECEGLAESVICVSFVEQLKVLARTHVTKCLQAKCENSSVIRLKEEFIGSAVYLKWMCDSGHIVHTWCSQAVLNRRVHSGDFLTCMSILTSGNNFGKMALWAKHLNLKFPSPTFFHKVQRYYMIPTINTYWEEKQNELLTTFKDKDVNVLGDGRNDSPGHSAQYCSYTLMEESSKKILTIQTLDKRTTELKSTNMEKVGFNKAMREILDNDLHVQEVVTDAHLGIGAVMKSTYPDIKHSHDIWHAAKNLGKKILKIAQKKENSVLVPWQRDILNHFWFSCSKATTYLEFLSIWRSLLHHITNQHQWVLSHGTGINSCLHDPLDPDEERSKPWLSPSKDRKAIEKLSAVILDERLLGKVHYYLNFRSTSELEVFHQLILMYCAKRFAYSPPVYKVRNRLAAIDHNYHSDRPLKRNKDGEIRYHRCFVKKSKRWSVFPEKEKKDYGYVKELKKRALVLRLEDRVGMKGKELEPGDPRRIAAHIAPVEPLPTKELVLQKK